MKTITKLINSSWISFNPISKLFALDLLHDQGTGFLLDLTNKEDISEFNDLQEFFEHKTEYVNLENSTSTLDMGWAYGSVVFVHSTAMISNPFNNPVDVLLQENIDEMLKLLKRIKRKI
jgi:hypothetical protein